MEKYVMALIVVVAVLVGIAMFYFKDKSKYLKPFVMLGAGLFAMVVNLAALNQACTFIVDAFIDSGFTSTTTVIISNVGLFVVIATTTAGALKIVFDKTMEEMEKDKNNK